MFSDVFLRNEFLTIQSNRRQTTDSAVIQVSLRIHSSYLVIVCFPCCRLRSFICWLLYFLWEISISPAGWIRQELKVAFSHIFRKGKGPCEGVGFLREGGVTADDIMNIHIVLVTPPLINRWGSMDFQKFGRMVGLKNLSDDWLKLACFFLTTVITSWTMVVDGVGGARMVVAKVGGSHIFINGWVPKNWGGSPKNVVGFDANYESGTTLW